MRAEPYPIRPIALRMKNFRGWLGEHELRFGPGLTLLVGENASGKSSTLNAVEWCLFGGEVARKLKELPVTVDIPVIFLTGMFPKRDTKDDFHVVDGNIILDKPYEMGELFIAIKKLLEEKVTA